MQDDSPQAGLELLSTAQASHYDLAASDVSSGPFPAPLPSLDLSGMAEWTLYGRALGDRAIHLLRIRELRILWLCRGRWRGWILQWLPTSAAKAGREVYRCSAVRAVDSRRFSHDALLSANLMSNGSFSPVVPELYPRPGSFAPIQILSIVRINDRRLRTRATQIL